MLFTDAEEKMVNLRVIQGGKSAGTLPAAAIRLYTAYSVMDGFKGHDCVKMNWIYLNREWPVAPFERLITNYKNLNKNIRPYFEECVKEFFSLDEVNALKAYLAGRGTMLYVNEEVLPVTDMFVPISFRQISPREGRGFFDLSAEQDNKLPFKVLGYYDLRNCPLSLNLPDDLKQKGILYLEEALKSLPGDLKTKYPELELLVDTLYDQYGLYVQRGQTREERLKARETFVRQE